jgi:TIR domain
MVDSTRPFLVLYILWHPGYKAGATIAESLREHFRREHYRNVAGGAGVSVIFRSIPGPGSVTPLPIDFDEGETSAAVILAESNLVEDPRWVDYVRELVQRTEAAGLGSRVFPVTLNRNALNINVDEQALRWDRWTGSKSERRQRLIRELAYELCRMLRHYLEHLKRPTEDEVALERYLKKVQIFLSHSKHDSDGERIANAIRDHLHAGHGLASFFDVHDIPAGLRFQKVLLQQVKVSAVIAIHTDSYSSREWCRREIIEAKRWNVPLIVTNCISDLDERGFPYLGNVPIVRMDPHGVDRIDFVIGSLLDEVLKDFLWQCRVELTRKIADPSVVFLPRPPELISLASLPPPTAVPEPLIVYPDPPLSAEEQRLFEAVAPRVRLRSMTEWVAGAGR